MGAWGYRAFENDDAADYADEVAGAKDTSILTVAFEAIPDDDEEEVEAPEASVAIAAAEIVAAMCGAESGDLADSLQEWVEQQGDPDPALVAEAGRAVSRVLRNSELRSLWDESKDGGAWRARVKDLLARLR